jgi:hypothetical protein
MATKTRTTKKGGLTTEFMAMAASNPEGALATKFLDAFGTDLATLLVVAAKLVATNDTSVMMLCATAGVQIRAHVVFVGRDFAGIRSKYPELIIEGDREQSDVYNFSALHALGHVLGHASGHDNAKKMLNKAGSSITGENCTQGEAGVINKEISQSWAPSDVLAFRTWVAQVMSDAGHSKVLNDFFAAIGAKRDAFKAGSVPSATSASTKRPAAVPPASAAKVE